MSDDSIVQYISHTCCLAAIGDPGLGKDSILHVLEVESVLLGCCTQRQQQHRGSVILSCPAHAKVCLQYSTGQCPFGCPIPTVRTENLVGPSFPD